MVTPAEATVVRNMVDHAEGLRRLCQLVATALNSEGEAGMGHAIEALGWMAGKISENLSILADPTTI